MSEFERKVSRNLQCPVCLELLSDPKQLSCTHTFCKECLNAILKMSSHTFLTCPICRSKTSVKGGNVLNLNNNVPLKSLIDDVRNSQQVCEMCDSDSRAVHYCCECGRNMCNTCLDIHNKWPLNVKHRVVRVEDIREGRVVLEREVYCQEHKADKQKHLCTDVCTTCKKFICLRCRLLSHENIGHTVQNTEEYNASTKTQIVFLQARGKTKVTAIKNHVTCIKTQKKRVTDHIAGKKAEINKIHEEVLKRKAALDKQLDAQKVELCKRLDEMKDVDERLITSIESASVLAGNSMKAPLEGDIIVIRDTLYGELQNVLDREDPENKLATDVAERAEQMTLTAERAEQMTLTAERAEQMTLTAERAEQMTLTAERAEQMKLTPKCQLNFGRLQKKAVGIVMVGFVVVVACILSTPFNRSDQLNNGEVRFVICATVCDVELTKKDIMNGIAATPDGRMAVGYSTGGIDIFSANGQLQKTVLKDVGICEVGYLSDGRYVVLNGNNNVTMYTKESEKLDVTFDSLSKDESGEFGGLAVDSKDLIYVAYRKAKKIQVFSPDGGKAIREIPCDGYTPMQITSYNDVLIIRGGNTVRIIDKDGNVKHNVEKLNAFGYPAVIQNNSIMIAWVKHDRGLFSIDEYTSELKYVKTLISDHGIDKPETNWYYLREFRSGEIAFCTPDILKTFKVTITPRSP